MKIKYFFTMIIGSMLAISCITDDSTTGSISTSKISLEQALPTKYTVNRWDTLRIAPTVVQSNTPKDIAYEWEINYKVVSTDRELNYICSEFGKFPCRLKVTNGDDIQYYQFDLDVQYSYVRGLYVLAEYQGKAIVSYQPDQIEGKNFVFDALEKNNPTIDFKQTPKAITKADIVTINSDLLYIALGNPSKLYEINPNLMTIGLTHQASGNITWLAQDPDSYPSNILVMQGSGFYKHATMSTNTAYYEFSTKEWGSTISGTPIMAQNCTEWWRNDLSYQHAIGFFENSQGRLLMRVTEIPVSDKEVLAGTFKGDSLIGMGSIDSQRDLVLSTWNKADNKFYFYHIFPGYYTTTESKRVPAVLKYKVEMPMSSGINKNAVFIATATKNLAYYSAGNKVYAYNVLSNGNFPTTPFISVGDAAEKIVSLYLGDNDNKLYIATNNTAMDMAGSLYCYDIVAGKMLWQQRNITGTIVGMIYRQ